MMTRRDMLVLAGGAVVATQDADISSGASISPVDLRCEYLTNPQGIDVLRPRLSWRCAQRVPGASNLRQTAYRIRVASTAANLKNGNAELWDSGRIETSQAQQIAYAGATLTTRQLAVWSVQIWDQDGRSAVSAGLASWSMGLLDPDDWQAEWIGLDTPPPPEALEAEWFWTDEDRPMGQTLPGKRYFRRHFVLTQPAEQAALQAWVSAGDFARLSVDGIPIGEQYGWADASLMPLPALAAGPHVMAAETLNLGSVPKAAGLAVRLDPLFSTASGWLGHDREAPGWQRPTFDDAAWRPVIAWGKTGMPPWGRVAVHRPLPVPARWLRRAFTLDAPPPRAPPLGAPPLRASVSFCGLGWSELYVNGQRVGDAALSPPLADYDRRVFYVTYDVAALLQPGENVLGVVLGAGRFVAPRPTQRSFGWPKLKLRLDMQWPGGRTMAVTSDTAWRLTLDGPIRDANEYDGEIWDGRLAFPGWATPGFDAASWRDAAIVDAPAGRLCALRQEPTRVTQTRAPLRCIPTAPDSWTFDFGQNLAGVCRLRSTGARGDQVTLHHAERLHPDGTLDTANLRSALARDVFVLAGGAEETCTPRFTSHGFRYVRATGLAHPPAADTLVALVRSDDLRRTGAFDCSDPLLTRIHDAAMWSVRNNCRSIRTDCPQRDERQGWLGDPAEEARGEAYLFDNAAFYAKWLDDMLDAQRPDGAMPDIAPSYWAFYNDDLSWPATLAIIPGILHEHYGDTGVIARVFPALSRWLDRMWAKAGDTYGDWGLLGMRGMNPDPLIAAAYLPHCQTLLAGYATLLGHAEVAAVATTRAASATADFHRRFFRPADGLYGDGGATACILPLAFGLAPPEHIPALRERLISLILARGQPHPCFGLIGAQWVSRVLQQAGRGDLVHRMAVARTRPSLGYMIEQGATTLWELWDGDTADPAMSSLDHTMLTGDLLVWLYQDLAGIRPDPALPGFARAILAPQPIPTLTWARATYDAATGRFESAWRREAGQVVFDFVVPPNVTATVILPGFAPFAVASGRHRHTVPDPGTDPKE